MLPIATYQTTSIAKSVLTGEGHFTSLFLFHWLDSLVSCYLLA